VINISKKVQNLLDFLPEETGNLQLCGIDEAGRGPLAGPLVVAGVILEKRINGLTTKMKEELSEKEKALERLIKKAK